MSNMLPMLYETLFGIFALFVLTKLLAKTQISQLTPFDFIAAIVLGELVGNALFDKEAGIIDIAFVIVLWGVILYLIEIVTQKFKGSRYILEGKPSLVIHKGEIIYEELRKNKMDMNEILHLLRLKDIFSVEEVEYAVLETDGLISVMKKPAYEIPTKQDLNVKQEEVQMATPLIMDGELIDDNLKETGVSIEWIRKEIVKHDLKEIKEVFYAEYKEGKKLFVLPYKKIKHKDYENKMKK